MSCLLGIASIFSNTIIGVPYFLALVMYFIFMENKTNQSNFKERFVRLTLFVGTAMVSIIIFSQKIDLRVILNIWGTSRIDELPRPEKFNLSIYSHLWYSEIILFVIALIGIKNIVKLRNKSSSKIILVVILILIFFVIGLIKKTPEYFLILTALSSIPFNYEITRWIKINFEGKISTSGKFLLVVVIMFSTHYMSLMFMTNAKSNDLLGYKDEAQYYYQALRGIEDGEQIAVISKQGRLLERTALGLGKGNGGVPKELIAAFNNIFTIFKYNTRIDDIPENYKYIIKRTPRRVMFITNEP